MAGGMHREASSGAGAVAGAEISAMAARLGRHAGQLGDVRRHALSVGLLSWESPAGTNFRAYLAERCEELGRTVDLLEDAARELGVLASLVRDAEEWQRGAGL